MRCLYRVAGVTGLLLWGCGGAQEVPSTDPVVDAFEVGWNVDTVGVANIAEGDTINLDVGLTIIETTRIFPPEANGGEVFAWEFEARELTPRYCRVTAASRPRPFSRQCGNPKKRVLPGHHAKLL